MLNAAFAVLTVAAALGAWLAAQVMRGGTEAPAWRLPAVHGVAGGVGLLVLFLALRSGTPRGVAEGAGPFGWDAAVLLAAALVAGLAGLFRRGRSGLVLALHVILAMFGYTLLLTYVSFD